MTERGKKAFPSFVFWQAYDLALMNVVHVRRLSRDGTFLRGGAETRIVHAFRPIYRILCLPPSAHACKRLSLILTLSVPFHIRSTVPKLPPIALLVPCL